MRRIYLALFGLFASFAFTAAAFAADPAVVLLQGRYDKIASMKAEFTQVLLHKESGAKESRKGVLQFKKPLLVRWETKDPSPELLVVTKTEIWNVFPDEDVAYKYPLSLVKDSNGIIQVMTGQAKLDKDFKVENKGKENGLTKLLLYPNEPVQALVEAVLWVDDSGLIKKFRIYDFYGNENEVTFTTQNVGVALGDSAFSFVPLKGMQVEDRTRDTPETMQKPLLQ